VPTPDRRPRGHNRRAQRHKDESQGSLLERINAASLPLRQQLGQTLGQLRNRDASRPKTDQGRKWQTPLPRKHCIALLILVPVWLILLAWEPAPSAPQAAPSGVLSVPVAIPVQAQNELRQPQNQAKVAVEPEPVNGKWLRHKVAAGETLFSLFRQFQLPGVELSRLIAIEGPDRPLTRMQTGKSLNILVGDDQRIQRVEIRDDFQVLYRYDRQGEGFALKE
jgi:uncharacterized protein